MFDVLCLNVCCACFICYVVNTYNYVNLTNNFIYNFYIYFSRMNELG